MGTHARIEIGYVVIDAAAWLEQRTAGPIPELTVDLQTWATRTRARDASLYRWADLVPLWRVARGYVSPDPADPGDPALISHVGTRLDADLWIARMLVPEYGCVAVVLRNDDPPAVHTDTSETADWYDADTVDIVCPGGGHGWTWRSGRELLDAATGSFTTLTVVFGPNLDAPFTPCPLCQEYQAGRRGDPCDCDGSSWILCPICGRRCDVELPQR